MLIQSKFGYFCNIGSVWLFHISLFHYHSLRIIKVMSLGYIYARYPHRRGSKPIDAHRIVLAQCVNGK
jgi:hypothetical protein